MKKILTDAFKAIRKEIIEGLSSKKVGENAKGQITKYFDKHTENKIISILKQKLKFKAVIISEELKEEITINKTMGNKPYYIIIDPVDGSDNYANGIPFVAFGLGIFDCCLNPVYSFTGNYYTGDYIYCDTKNIIFNGKEFYPNKAKRPDGGRLLLLALKNLKFRKKEKLFNYLKGFESVRSLGSTISELILVVKGKASAFVDYRNELTLENFAPFLLIAKKSGCVISDVNGRDIVLKTLSMTKPYNVVVSGNNAIHRQIINSIKKLK